MVTITYYGDEVLEWQCMWLLRRRKVRSDTLGGVPSKMLGDSSG